MKAVYALYSDGQLAQQAVNGLRAAGVAGRHITVLSAQPMEDYEFGDVDKGTWMWWFASAGGLLGMLLGVWLTEMTQTAWPLVVGGMPIVAWWPNLIIIFELTMLGAIVSTAVTLLVTASLPGRGAKLYDPEVTNGNILVGVENPQEGSVGIIEGALRLAPDTRVKTV